MEKINKLKKIIINENIDGYIISKNNEFFGEYIPDCENRLKYISNFSGSYGFAIVLNDKSFLFVDGRYTLQANKQSGNYFKVKTLPNELPKDILQKKKLKIGFDPKLFTKIFFNTFFKKTNCEFIPIDKNLIDKVWVRKKNNQKNKFYTLPKNAIGESYKSKVNKIALELKKSRADYLFITASENNAWLLNIRGNDSKYTPIPHSYILMDAKKNINFFCDLKKISLRLKRKLNKVKFLDINNTDRKLLEISKKKFIIDKHTCSFYFENLIFKNNTILAREDPAYLFKAVKTRKEIDNIKKAHVYDGAALTKCLFWLKKNFIKKK